MINLKILHLEGVNTDAALVRTELKKAKMAFKKLDVDNKADFVRILKDFEPDVILSDHSVPSFNALEALSLLKKSGLYVPFILVVAPASKEFALSAMKDGVADFILKDRVLRLPSAIINAVEKIKLEESQRNDLNNLIESRNLLKEMESVAKIGSLDINLITGVRKWSAGVDDLLGYQPGQITPSFEAFVERVHRDDVSRLAEEFNYAVANLESTDIEYRIITPAGIMKYMHTKLLISKDKHGVTVRVHGFVQDVTEKKTSQLKLNQANLELSRLFNTIDDVFFSRDVITNKLIQISPGCEKMYGYKQEEFLAEKDLWRRIMHPDNAKLPQDNDARYARGETVINVYKIIHKEKGVRWAESKIIPTLDDKGKLIRLDGTTRDITDRKLMELELQQSELRLRVLIENSTDIISLSNLEGDMIYTSDNIKKILGYSKEDYNVARHNKNFVHPADRANREKVFLQTRQNPDKVVHFMHRIKHADGNWLWVEGTLTNLLHVPAVRGVICNYRDISERKAQEDALKNSEANLSAIIENTTDLVYSLDNDLRFITYNKLFETTVQQVYGLVVEKNSNALDLLVGLGPEAAEKWRTIYNKTLMGEQQQFVNEYPHGDAKVYLSYSVNPISQGGKVIGLSCFSRNITQQKLDEVALIKSEANLRSVFENTDLSIILYNTDFEIVSFNSNANLRTMGIFAKKLRIGNSGFDYFPKSRWSDIRQAIQRVKNKEVVAYEAVYNSKGGSKEWFEAKWMGVLNAGSEIVGIILTFKNITANKNAQLEREKMTADIIRRNQDLEQFTYIISHNLRAPVANIKGLTELLHHSDVPNSYDADALNALSSSVNQLDKVIIDLNHVLEVGKQINDKKEKIDLEQLIAEIKLEIKLIIEKNKVVLNCDFIQLNEVFTIRSYIYSIFQNLITNSIKYRRNNIDPVINIKTDLNGEVVVISVEDNGKGIDLARSGVHLFGLYKRFDFSVEGKGMGLFMVKKQVESLGGTIEVTSEIGKGTKFLMQLPV
jgi:PAS domain S-box-containing protein